MGETAEQAADAVERVKGLAEHWEQQADEMEAKARDLRDRASELRGQIEEPRTAVSEVFHPGGFTGCRCTPSDGPNPSCPMHAWVTNIIATDPRGPR
jgi:hypothetical protein